MSPTDRDILAAEPTAADAQRCAISTSDRAAKARAIARVDRLITRLAEEDSK